MRLLFFILGFLLGIGFGVFIMCIMAVSGRESELERQREARRATNDTQDRSDCPIG